MNEPYIALYVDDKKLVFEKKLPTEVKSREIFNIPVKQLISIGADGVSKRIGLTSLGLLRLWHEDIFAGLNDGLDDSNDHLNDDFMVALFLIERFSKACSEDRLRLVDEILSDAAGSDEEAKKYFNEVWPALRKKLLG